MSSLEQIDQSKIYLNDEKLIDYDFNFTNRIIFPSLAVAVLLSTDREITFIA